MTTVFQRPLRAGSIGAGEPGVTAFTCAVAPTGRREIDHLLDAVGLAALAQAPAHTLSGGEIQRVALARALAFDPEVLLLDEPTANLDPRNVRLVEDLIRERQAQGVTIVLATHQIFQARRLAHRAALLLDGQMIEVATDGADARSRGRPAHAGVPERGHGVLTAQGSRLRAQGSGQEAEG